MRMYQVATEANIADQIFPYIKQQSMTMAEEEYLRTIIKLNTKRKGGDYTDRAFIAVDFSYWCSQFRYELATPIFALIDQLFGLLGVYAFTHIFPIVSDILFQDRFNPPRQAADGSPIPGPMCMHGSEAWMDGLRQKGWTLVTILIILSETYKMDTVASLLGQGDNQVICLRIPLPKGLQARGQTWKQYIKQFLDELETATNRSGIPIRKNESWFATDLFEYSRSYHYKGAQASNALKRTSRVASEANKTVPTLAVDISGMVSTGSAAASNDHDPTASYLVTTFEAAVRLEETFRG